MVVDVKMCKEDGKPFGFRLIGGADFEIPLTCSRVIEGSTAEKCGLICGDVVVRINDKPTITMTHEDAHLELVAAGPEFVLGVLRGTSLLPEEETNEQTVAHDVELAQEQARIDKIIPDASVTDEEIAELLSGEAEVLKGHGVLGVNFKKMMPKAGVFKQSEVFQVLNEEQLKTKAEQEREDKYNWTTFLQKPQRPPPTRSTQPVLINTYKPQIVKQPKPKCAPDYRAPTPDQPQVQETTQQIEEEAIVEEEEIVEQAEVHETHSYVAEVTTHTTVTSSTTCETTCETVTSFEELAADATGEPLNEELIAEEVKSQEDEVSVVSSAMAEQLANVQVQLMALSHLPKTIQSTLDEITKQLQALIPPTKSKLKSVEPEANAEVASVTAEDVQVHVEQSSETVVVTSDLHVEETQSSLEVTASEEQKQEDDTSIHYSQDDVEEYEESQAKFRALWEKKREAKVRVKMGPWEISAVREVEDLNWLETVPIYHFTVPLPKKKYNDY